jgi:glycosyltransferase involved in cell wall biosynthesis
MTSDNFRLCLIAHPFIPAKNSGRGNDRYTYELLSNLNKNGINVKILDSGYYGSLLKAIGKEIILPFKLIHASAEIYHAICPAGAKTAIVLRKSPIVTTIHDMIPFYFESDYEHSWIYAYHRFCTRLSAIKSDRVIVPFEWTKRELISRFKVPESRIKVIRYGIDHHAFHPSREGGKGNTTKRVLFIGGITRSKGVDVLIKAFSIVEKEIKEVELLLGGKEVGGRKKKDQEQIRELPRKLEIADKVKFLGYIPEDSLPMLYNLADVAVFPSSYGFGLPVIEAMVCGTPTIAGASLDAAEGYGDAAFLVEPGNVTQLAHTILEVLTNGELREELVEKGVERAKLFSWETMTRETIKVYESLLS